jgi:hypothetical protein
MANNNAFNEYNIIYKKYIGNNIDSNFIVTWYKTSSEKNRTNGMFKNYLLNSDIYYKTVYNKINKIYSRLVTTTLNENFVKDFMKYNKDNELTDDNIFKYITQSNDYKQFNSNLIELFYKFLTGKECILQSMDKYQELFSTNTYSYELLHKQICIDEKISIDKIELIKNEFYELKGYNIDLKTIIEILTQLKDDTTVIKSLIVNNNIFNNKALYDFINIYNSSFNRDIHVLEFIKYYPTIIDKKINTNENLTNEINDIQKTHTEKLNIVINLYKKYVNITLSEKDYINKYHRLVDKLDYQNIIIDELIEKDEYNNLMKSKISSIFKKNYSIQITQFDLNYIYCIFKSKKYSLQDEEISQEILSINDFTKKYSAELNKIFNLILKRDPDISEYEFYITKYREDNDIKNTNLNTENDLIDGLEYQIVLRDTIISLYKDKYNKNAIPSTVFKILKNILDNNELKKDQVKIKEYIDSYEK